MRPVIQGKFETSSDPNIVLYTVLGSCVATCLYDPVARVGGMNHFLLPGLDPRQGGNVKYGLHSMEQLINNLLRAGAQRHNLVAQLYGGANVLQNLGSIGRENASFARQFLADENLPLVKSDLGGRDGRRLRFFPASGVSEVTRVPMEQEPPQPRAPVQRPVESAGTVELF